jgi:hypothetical protein
MYAEQFQIPIPDDFMEKLREISHE